MQTLPQLPRAAAPGRALAWLAAALFIAGLLAVGLLVYRDYGISWDEPTQLELGIKTYRYITRQDPALFSFRDRYYGPFFELVLMVFQKDSPPNEVYFSRHLINFLAFFSGCLAFFGLAIYLYRRAALALLGCAMLALSPRIFADAFYNSKDIPFLVFYLFSLFSLLLFVERPRPLTAALHGLLTAAMLAVRLPGLVIPALTIVALLFRAAARQVPARRAAALGLAYLAVTATLLVLFWPALWPNPPAELLEAFRMMKDFPHVTSMLFFGQEIRSDALPWFYIPAWIGLTTPPVILALFAAGLAWIAASLLRHPKTALRPEGLRALLLLASIFLPLAAVILMGSTLYDGWRQMFFLYPPMLLVALWGVDRLAVRFAPWSWQKTALALLLLAVGLAPTAAWMVRSHPYQNIYFNRLAGPDLRTVQARFPVDYWGLSYRAGLEYLLENDPSASIPVFVETEAGARSAALFTNEEQQRLRFVKELKEAKYYVGSYSRERSYPFRNRIFSVEVGGTPILSVFLLDAGEKE